MDRSLAVFLRSLRDPSPDSDAAGYESALMTSLHKYSLTLQAAPCCYEPLVVSYESSQYHLDHIGAVVCSEPVE